MAEQGIHKINQLHRSYISYQVVADVLFSAGMAALTGCLLYVIFAVSIWWSVLIFGILLGSISAIKKWWRVDISTITNFLNIKYPDLEESSELTLKEPSDLNLLEKMQLAKVEDILELVPPVQKQFTQRLRLSILVFFAAIIVGFAVIRVPGYWDDAGSKIFEHGKSVLKNSPPEKILPQIEAVDITIIPPSYTGKSKREQDKFTLEAEDGSTADWKLKLNIAARDVAFIFNGKDRIRLSKTGDADYSCQRKIDAPGFYQVDIDGKLSDLYQILVIKDAPPVIHVKTPTQYTYIDAGEAPRVNVTASVDDDYGISNAFIYATTAKGSGEAVKFKEQKIDFGMAFNGQTRHYDLQKLINLPSLNVEPGDELYFYIQAQDNHGQQSRTDVYIIAMQDTAQLLSMDGLLSGVNIKPEYFRSERQIILDSQKLLKDKDSISTEQFNNRSNDLGTDQKLLRLRYGKFLGEEAESEIDPREKQSDQPADPKDFGNGAKILDEYTDKHDNAEDAQFFDPAVKAQLKATLNEMWKAELQLRLNKPEAALPFEYKALRLLKDLQQKSRVYVAKTAYNPSPLKMEKRLTGDLGKIIQPSDHQDVRTDDQYATLKNSVGIMEELKSTNTISISDKHTLQLAYQDLSEKATTQPELYIPAVNSFRRILSSQKANAYDIGIVEHAIQRILPPGKQLPNTAQNSADMGLSKGYYQNLNRK